MNMEQRLCAPTDQQESNNYFNNKPFQDSFKLIKNKIQLHNFFICINDSYILSGYASLFMPRSHLFIPLYIDLICLYPYLQYKFYHIHSMVQKFGVQKLPLHNLIIFLKFVVENLLQPSWPLLKKRERERERERERDQLAMK